MTGRERLAITLKGGQADRVPFLPQICFPHAVRQLETDYRRGIIRCIEDPLYRMEIMHEITRLYHSDGLRIQNPDPRLLSVADDTDRPLVRLKSSGEVIGWLDFQTGGINSEHFPVKNIEDANAIPVRSVEEWLASDEMKLVRSACSAAPDLNKIGSLAIGLSHLVQARGATKALLDLFDAPELVQVILKRSLEDTVNRALALRQCGIDTFYIGDPWSSSSVMAPRFFTQFAFFSFQGFVDRVKDQTTAVYGHICGNIEPILEKIVESGIDCLEPLDPLGGLSVAEVRHRVGPTIALMGGVNTLTLASGDSEAVERQARDCIAGGGQNGAYILAAGDMVPTDTPRQNVLAMWQVARAASY